MSIRTGGAPRLHDPAGYLKIRLGQAEITETECVEGGQDSL